MRLRRRLILIADDDAATLEGLAEFLDQVGYRIVTSRDGQDVMNLLVGGLHPDLLILDLAMPHLGGEALLKYVQSDPVLRLVPVLVVTGAPEQIGRAAVDVILPKPVDLAALLVHVRRLISESRDSAESVEIV
jgi:CheY-like chemotaxis protein